MVLGSIVSSSMLGSTGAGVATGTGPGAGAGAGVASGAGAGVGAGGGMPKPTSAGEGSIGKTSQALSGESAGGGDIIRANPYGEGAASADTGATSGQIAGKGMGELGKGMTQSSQKPSASFGPSYNALFSPVQMPQTEQERPMAPMSINAPMMNTGPAASAGMVNAPMISPGATATLPIGVGMGANTPQAPNLPMGQNALPSPMPLMMGQPPVAPVEPVVPPQLSDKRAKKNVQSANAMINNLLNDIYQEVLTRKGNR